MHREHVQVQVHVQVQMHSLINVREESKVSSALSVCLSISFLSDSRRLICCAADDAGGDGRAQRADAHGRRPRERDGGGDLRRPHARKSPAPEGLQSRVRDAFTV